MNSDLLAEAKCYFAGGTRVTMEIDEYRVSNDIDFACSDADGWREIRRSVQRNAFNELFNVQPQLLRDVRYDQYAIRTFLKTSACPVKMEIIYEGHLELEGTKADHLPVMHTDRASAIAQKLLANADRGLDMAFHFRYLVDLAFMIDFYDKASFDTGWRSASSAYSEDVIREGLHKVIGRIQTQTSTWTKSLSHMQIPEDKYATLASGVISLAQTCDLGITTYSVWNIDPFARISTLDRD